MEYGVGYSRLWFASGPIGRLGGPKVFLRGAHGVAMLDLGIIVLCLGIVVEI